MDDLFGLAARQARALARTCDPDTSKDAAVKMVESGALSRQESRVYEGILRYYRDVAVERNFTAKELAYWNNAFGLNYYTIQRRLSGLLNKKKIERIQIGQERIGATNLFKPIYKKRDGCCVWRLK